MKRRTTLLVVFLAACSTLGTPERPPLATAVADDGLRFTTHDAIPHERSSVKGARWDEYVVTLENEGWRRIVIRAVTIESASLPATEHTSRRDLLESATKRHARLLQTRAADGETSLGDDGPSVECEIDDGGEAGRFMARVLGNVLSAVASAAIRSRLPLGVPPGRETRCRIDNDLERTAFSFPLKLDPRKELTRSLYFPVTPQPTVLRVSYESEDEARTLPVPLPAVPAPEGRRN